MGMMNRMRAGMALVVALGAATAPAAAQEPMITDRPDFTESAFTVGSGVAQIEAGYTYFERGPTTMHQIGEALIRYGIIPNLEARVLLPSYLSANTDVGPLESDASGFGDANLGIKLGLVQNEAGEGLPSIGLILGSSVPVGADDFTSDAWEPEAKLALGWSVTERIGLGANVNYAQRDPGAGDRYNEFGASVSLGLPITARMGAFAEYYAIRPEDRADQDYIDGGVTFSLTDDFQLDGRVGYGLNDIDSDWFFGVGLARRF